jgi:3-hydroxyacyl-CoA dehydrogenase
MEINAVGIVGAGQAGAGAAEALLRAGLQVRLYDGFRDGLAAAMAKLQWALRREGKAELLAGIEGVQDLSKFNGADLVIEAEPKSEEEARVFYGKLLPHLDAGCLLALNVAARPLQGAALACGLPPERTLGLNFARPARSNGLVEVVRGERTGDEAVEAVCAALRRAGKTPVVARDNPGQITGRLWRPFLLAALRLLEAGKGTPDEIDTAFRGLSGAAAGPFEAADAAGLDYELRAGEYVYSALGSPERLAPAPVLDRLVQYGQLGRKSTIGFYLYEDGAVAGENPVLPNLVKYLGLKKIPAGEIFGELMRPVLEEAKLLAGEIMASEYDMETAARLAFGWPKGPFGYARDLPELMRKKVVSQFENLDTF